MNKKTKYFSIFLTLLVSLTMVISISLNTDDIANIKQKNIFVKTVALPDLAISTEATHIRHRSLSSVEKIFPDGPEHIEYFPSSFSISYKE